MNRIMPNFKSYVINLDRNLDRLQQFYEHAKLSGLHNIDRVAGIDGKQLTEAELYKHYDAQHNTKNYFKTLNPGEIGCYLSHRKVWQKMIDDNIDFALILEDDALCDKRLPTAIQRLAPSHQEWDVIKLFSKRKQAFFVPSTSLVEGVELAPAFKVPITTMGQLVSLQGAKKLLSGSDRFGRPVDVDMQWWWESRLKVLSVYPSLVRNNGQTSEINAMGQRHKQKYSKLHKLALKAKSSYQRFANYSNLSPIPDLPPSTLYDEEPLSETNKM